MNNNFDEFENLGREKLKTVFPSVDWRFTADKYAPFDAVAKHKNKTVIAEIKTRTFPTWQYDSCFLEVEKLHRLNSVQDADEKIYVVHYSNNKTATWNLSNITEPEILQVKMNYQTAENTGKQLKDVIELKLSQADIRYTSTAQKTTQYNENLKLK